MEKQIIILAAGKGKRMKSDLPKVLCPINGRPMITYLIKTIESLKLSKDPIIVVGYQAQKVKDALGDAYNYVTQKEQLGTGHAVACAEVALKDFKGEILILYGDMPLVSADTIKKIFDKHEESRAILTMATTKVADFNDWRAGFSSFSRVLRNKDNEITSIREAVDCSPAELKITEVNPSYFCFDSEWLWKNIKDLKTDNKQRELYLTDLIQIAFDQKLAINSIMIDAYECLGVNTPEQLALVEKILAEK